MNAADYYVVPGLKRLCEQWLVETLNTTNMVDRFSSQAMSLLWTYFPVDSFWGTRSTRRSWGTLPRRCCWPTRRSSTPSLTGGTSSPLGLSWCWKFLESWPGAHCKLRSKRDTFFHIWHLNSTHIFSLWKELINVSVIQSWMMNTRITVSLNTSKYILVTLFMSILA